MDVANFINPKELLKAKREIVEAALALARPIVALTYADGILLMAENPSRSLNKISEVYDRILFAGTGVYNDYERLRRAGVQYADVKGFSYSRSDVKAKAIATEYSTILGDIFSRQQVPWEVEILVAEIGDTAADDRLYVIPFHGGLIEESGFCAIGDILRDKDGELRKNLLRKRLEEKRLKGDEPLERAVRAGFEVLASLKEAGKESGSPLDEKSLEVVALDRTIKRARKVRRIPAAELRALLGR